MRVAEFHETGAFGMLRYVTLEGDGAHFVELAFGRAHSGFFPIFLGIVAGL
jgi:hypothetical protein